MGSGGTSTGALTDAARSALASACSRVDDGSADDAVDGVPAGVVVRPGSTEEVAEVLGVTEAYGLSVVPRGRGTKLTWGRPPDRADVLVDVAALDRVVDHAAGDLVLVAQAGARLDDVQGVLAGAGQRLGVDTTVAGASLGGTLVAGTSGPRRVATGTMRDLLIGVTLVRADGVVARSGGRVVKNVAGYDLGKLVGGSFGTLAVVTETVFRLHPLPEAQRYVVVPVADPAQAHAVVQAVVHAQVVPAAVEVDWPETGAGTVTVLLEGIAEGVAGRTAGTLALLGADATEREEPPPGWGGYPWSPAARGDGRATAVKLTHALSGLPDVLDAARRANAPVHVRGSAGAGVLYGAVPAGTEPPRVAAALARLREVCARHGGHAVVVDAAAAVKDALDVWGPVGGLELMRRVKDQFDPGHRLSPGRFVGGI